MDWKYHLRNVSFLERSYNIWGILFFIEDRRVCEKPLRSRLAAIQKLKPLITVKGCTRFAGMVNFINLFCPELQKLLKAIYDFTRKGRQFIWEDGWQNDFEKITKTPILHLPDNKGRFHLYSDTSKFTTGSTLYQIQNGKSKLIAYVSKRLPDAEQHYLVP